MMTQGEAGQQYVQAADISAAPPASTRRGMWTDPQLKRPLLIVARLGDAPLFRLVLERGEVVNRKQERARNERVEEVADEGRGED